MESNAKAASFNEVFSPIDGASIGRVPVLSLPEALAAAARARQAQAVWGALSLSSRVHRVRALLRVLSDHQKEMAELLTAESGKTLLESYLFEVASVLHLGDYFTKNAERILAPRSLSIALFRNRASYIHYRPRGVVLVIAPWNFPLANSMGEALMALIAGNAVLLKPASLTPLTALKMREYADEAGLDRDLFQIITGPGRLASDLIEKADINFVSFTGSTETGRRVAELCGRRLIPCTMELGGKAPALVLADADLEIAARAVTWGAFANSGQICASVERVFVHRELYPQFVDRVVEITQRLRHGDPRENEMDVGAMVDARQLEVVDRLVSEALQHGARLLTGGRRLGGKGNYYAPTVLVDVTPDMAVMREESFGPLLPIMAVDSEEEAIQLANDTRYGLMAYVFSRNRTHAKRVAEQIQAGTVIINETLVTHAYPETPWGGIRDSGIGRVHSDDGLRELSLALHVNYDTIAMKNPLWYPYTQSTLNRFLGVFDLVQRKMPFRETIGAVLKVVTGRDRPLT